MENNTVSPRKFDEPTLGERYRSLLRQSGQAMIRILEDRYGAPESLSTASEEQASRGGPGAQ